MPELPERSNMKRREISEIKKQFTLAGCTITRIAGCIVNGEGERVCNINDNFLTIPEGMMFKYFDIFQKGLSGRKGKNLYSLEFKEGSGVRASLRSVRDNKLKERTEYEAMFDNIIAWCTLKGYYAIFTIHAAYDIPGRTTDGKEMEDASDEVYEYIMTAICPITLQKPGLGWSMDENTVKEADRSWIIGMPQSAYLYPAFTDRKTDYDHVWFYTKKANEPEQNLIEVVLECKMPVTPIQQKEEFHAAVKGGTTCTYEMRKAKELFRELRTLAENQKDSEEPVTAGEIIKIAQKYGIETGEAVKEEMDISLQNVINLNTFEVGVTDAHVTVSADRTDLIDIREIEGKKYIVIYAEGDVYANGIQIGGNEP